MSTVAVNTITDAAGGSTATINGMTPTGDSLQGFRNRIINGDMRIAQRGTSFAGLTDGSNGFMLDRWFWNESGTSTAVQTVAQSTSVPANSGFANSLQVTTTTAQSPLASNNTYRFGQPIEGFNVADLMWGTVNAKTIALSFWVRSSLTGTFGGVLWNAAFNRFYVYSYAIDAADTWEFKTVTIAGDTSGTWATGNTIGMAVEFSFGAGSDYLTTPGSWGSTRKHAPTGQVNVAGTLNATFYITGVQLEAGSVATPFERVEYGAMLRACQRYCEVVKPSGLTTYAQMGVGACRNSTNASVVYFYQVAKRSQPTVTYTAANTFATTSSSDAALALTAIATDRSDVTSLAMAIGVSSGLTAGNATRLLQNDAASSQITISAEL